MDIGVIGRIEDLDGLEHLAWLVSRCGAIEIEERLTVDLSFQDREILSDALYVHGRYPWLGPNVAGVQRSRQRGVCTAFDDRAPVGKEVQLIALHPKAQHIVVVGDLAC